jgi:pimeloyl-ACP methyl ester carboxylesterase
VDAWDSVAGICSRRTSEAPDCPDTLFAQGCACWHIFERAEEEIVITPIQLSTHREFYEVEQPQQLIVLLHRYDATNLSMQRIAEVVRAQYPAGDIYAPTLPAGRLSFADPDELAGRIVNTISVHHNTTRYESIILVGHSLGAVLARKVWALAHGARPDATVEPDRCADWAHRIERIVLLAAFSRGWTISSALSPVTRFAWTLGSAWGNFCRHVLGKEPLIFAIRRGAAFLTVSRLQCLAVERQIDKKPIVVQLLGTDDDFIAPTDNLDLATGQNFYFLEVANATHGGIADLPGGEDPEGALSRFHLALTGDQQVLRENSLSPADVFDGYDEVDDFDSAALPNADREVGLVIFVIHGIRDRGFWTRRIARKIKYMARASNRKCRSITSTYGFFPMGPFLLPWVRRNKVEWLLDQYVTAKSLYPDAKFAYVGHSNGTYLLAKALEICPAIRFEEGAVFAGSMVRCDFEWTKYLPDRVSRVVNYIATADWVVAIFPHGLERMRLQDVGGAGHLGFLDSRVTNIHYAVGQHSAALTPDKWEEMANFVLNGTLPASRVPGLVADPRNELLGKYAPAIWGGTLLIALGPGLAMLGVLYWLGGPWAAVLTLIFAIYLFALRMLLTRA